MRETKLPLINAFNSWTVENVRDRVAFNQCFQFLDSWKNVREGVAFNQCHGYYTKKIKLNLSRTL